MAARLKLHEEFQQEVRDMVQPGTSALFVIVSKYGFNDVLGTNVAVDPSRTAIRTTCERRPWRRRLRP